MFGSLDNPRGGAAALFPCCFGDTSSDEQEFAFPCLLVKQTHKESTLRLFRTRRKYYVAILVITNLTALNELKLCRPVQREVAVKKDSGRNKKHVRY